MLVKPGSTKEIPMKIIEKVEKNYSFRKSFKNLDDVNLQETERK